MEWTISYTISQILTIIKYSLLGASYFAKDRKKVLILIFTSIIVTFGIFILLRAWSGLATSAISFIANIVFLLDEKKHGKKEKNGKKDVIILLCIYSLSITAAIYTYQGVLSLFSIFAGMIFIYSIWQKNTRIYKLLGIVSSILWMVYNIYIMSIFGIILESVIFICSVTGYTIDKRIKKEKIN